MSGAAEQQPLAVSVVVPVYNAVATVGATLRALAAQQLSEPYEVLLVDCCSIDGTAAVLARALSDDSSLRLLESPRRDPGTARNLGAREARGRIVAFTDADCEPDPGWLAAGLKAIQEADLVQGRVLPLAQPGPFDRTVSVGAESGLYESANLFVRWELFERVGGFSTLPGLTLAAGSHFGEDVWFAWRAKRLGARSSFAPDALVHHAVFERGSAGFIAERARARHFPALVRAVPELRAAFLESRYFLSPDSRAFDLALAGLLLACRRHPIAALAVLPYARSLRRRAGQPGVALAYLAADLLTALSLAYGSLTAQTIVL